MRDSLYLWLRDDVTHLRRSRRLQCRAAAPLALVLAAFWPSGLVFATPSEAVRATTQRHQRQEAATVALSCPSGYYRNSQGGCTRRPSFGTQSGGTAVCRNGVISCSATRSETCSRHGAVACWLSGSGAAGVSGPTRDYCGNRGVSVTNALAHYPDRPSHWRW
jgi:hypothetical protein